jgi:hypothetical protein
VNRFGKNAHKGKDPVDELAVHAVGQAAVARDRVAEICPSTARSAGCLSSAKLWNSPLMPKARLKPEAKKPPNGATSEAKAARTTAWSWNGAHGIDVMW